MSDEGLVFVAPYQHTFHTRRDCCHLRHEHTVYMNRRTSLDRVVVAPRTLCGTCAKRRPVGEAGP